MRYIKIEVLVLVVVFFLSGCASTREFTKNINESEYILTEDKNVTLALGPENLDAYSDVIGSDKSGYISPDRSKERIDFRKDYPIATPNSKDYDEISGHFYNVKVGRVLMLAADIDSRTSGFIKDGRGNPLSVSNLMTIESTAIATGALVSGGNQAIVSTINPNLMINPTQSIGANIGAGLVAGLLVGIVGHVLDQAAVADVVARDSFGRRMEVIRGFGNLPIPWRMDKFGLMSSAAHMKIAPGMVKSVYMVSGKKNLQFKTQTFLISTVGLFRGERYKSSYPSTLGWEFIITNINMIEINAELSGEERYNEMKRELSAKGIRL